MTDDILKRLSEYKANEEMRLARLVRSREGAKRYGQPMGAIITKDIRALAKLKAPSTVDPETGRVKKVGKTGKENHKLFAEKVAELKEKIEKLDAQAIRSLLDQMKKAKNVPKSKNYLMVRRMLEQYLEDKANKKPPRK
jgi:hypothetical protein